MYDSQQQSGQILTTTTTTQQAQINQMIDAFKDEFAAYLPYALGLSALLTLFILINLVQKFRASKAVLRMDKNLQKLVSHIDMMSTVSMAKEMTGAKHTEEKPSDEQAGVKSDKPEVDVDALMGHESGAKKGWYE